MMQEEQRKAVISSDSQPGRKSVKLKLSLKKGSRKHVSEHDLGGTGETDAPANQGPSTFKVLANRGAAGSSNMYLQFSNVQIHKGVLSFFQDTHPGMVSLFLK